MHTRTQARAEPRDHEVVPPRQQQQLRQAAARRDYDAIDSITDELVRLGLCWPRQRNVWVTQADRARAAARLRGV